MKKQQKAKACNRCNDMGWSRMMWQYGWRVGGFSPLFQIPVFKCPYCSKPSNEPDTPAGMFPLLADK